jgi:hypothetical protein
MSDDKLPLFDLTTKARADVVDAIVKAYDIGFAAGGSGALEQVAQWMIARSYATGHGDTIEALLVELEGQARGRWDKDARFLTLKDDPRKIHGIDERYEEDME